MKLQRERVIVIKPADKGSGIVILDFADYLTSCNNHLQSQQKQPDGSWKNYYSSVTEDDFKAAKDEIKGVLDEALKANLITKSDYDQMNPMDKGPSKFYEIFKMHKMKDGMRIPPERPIISGCGSITEQIGKYCQSFLSQISNKHESYLQDSPDFLRSLEDDLNDAKVIDDQDTIVTIDVSSLYTNIDQTEGVEICKEALKKTDNKPELNDFIIKLLELGLKHNIFTFNDQLYTLTIELYSPGSPGRT